MRFWQQWTAQRGYSTWLHGSSTQHQLRIISEFIIYGHLYGFGSGAGIRSTTIDSYLQGINHFFRSSNTPFPIQHTQVRLLLKGLRRFDGPRQHKHPVSLALLAECHRRLNFSAPAQRALWGVLCLGFFFLLRRSEIVATSGITFQWFALRAKDLRLLDTHHRHTSDVGQAVSVSMTLRGSKTNQNGHLQ